MTDRDAAIISALTAGFTLTDVARVHDLSRARVQQIYRAAQGKPRPAGRRTTTGRGVGPAVNVRLSQAELAELVAAAGCRGLVAAYLRRVGVEAARSARG